MKKATPTPESVPAWEDGAPSPRPKALSSSDHKMEKEPTEFEYMELLGSGSYGRVVRVRDKKDPSKLYAMKIMDKQQIANVHGRKHLSRCKRERKWLVELGCGRSDQPQHPYLVRLEYEMNTKNRVYLILELARRGDLSDVVKKSGPLPLETCRLVAAELMLAVAMLHKHKLIHRDIRPHNILLADSGHIQLTDLGVAGRNSSPHFFVIGASGYKAPEMLLSRKKGYTHSLDIWCIGVTLYLLHSGYKHPMKRFLKDKILKASLKSKDFDVSSFEFDPTFFSDKAKDLISKLMDPNPSTRLGSPRIHADPKDDKEAEASPIPLPKKEIRNHPYFSGIDWLALARKEGPVPFPETLVPIPELDVNAVPKFKNHIEVLAEFNKKDPTLLIAEMFA